MSIFSASQLDFAVRLHPGPLPQEYMALFMAASPPVSSTNSSVSPSNGATPAEGISGNATNARKRRRDVHLGGLGSVASESAIGPVPSTSTGANNPPATLLLRNQQQPPQQHHHHHHHPPSAAPAASSAGMAPHSGPPMNIAPNSLKPVTTGGYFATPQPANNVGLRRPGEDYSFMPSSGGGLSSVDSPGGDFDDELRRKRRRKEKKNSVSVRKERID